MKKLTVFIEGSDTTVDLDESLVVTNRIRHIYVKKAYVFWSYRNVKEDFSAISIGGKITKLYKGYYLYFRRYQKPVYGWVHDRSYYS